MHRAGLLAGVLFAVTGCANMDIDSSISRYNEVAPGIELGATRDEVLALLEPTQSQLRNEDRREADRYMQDGVRVEIYYMRSRRQADGITTDDEFTPYVFNDGILVAIGWQALGGPKTQGQATPTIYIDHRRGAIGPGYSR